MTKKIALTQSAAYDNQIAAFLGNCTKEAESSKAESIEEVYYVFRKYFYPQTHLSVSARSDRLMVLSTFIKKLRKAGYRVGEYEAQRYSTVPTKVYGLKLNRYL